MKLEHKYLVCQRHCAIEMPPKSGPLSRSCPSDVAMPVAALEGYMILSQSLSCTLLCWRFMLMPLSASVVNRSTAETLVAETLRSGFTFNRGPTLLIHDMRFQSTSAYVMKCIRPLLPLAVPSLAAANITVLPRMGLHDMLFKSCCLYTLPEPWLVVRWRRGRHVWIGRDRARLKRENARLWQR